MWRLLPNAFSGPPLYGSLERFVNERGSVGLHVRQYMQVEIKRDPYLAMPQPFASDLRMNSRGQQVSCVGVP